MTTDYRLTLSLGVLLALAAWAGPAGAQQDWIGPNLLANPGFEEANDQGLPADWTMTANPAGAATFSLDKSVFLVGTQALKAEVPATGNAAVACKPVPVEGGKWYLISVGYRTEGMGEPGKYSGVSGYVSVNWQDAEGKGLGGATGIAFPYHPVDWDLGDRFIQAPAGAGRLVLTASLGNNSENQTGKNIPSTMWLDGWQVREYTPPVTPDWAKAKVPRIVEGGLSTSRAQAYQLSSLGYAGGKWSAIVPDPEATYDSVITSPEGVGSRGIMAHSPYFTNPPPGLYRAVLRCKVADNTGDKEAGSMDVFAEKASGRAELHLFPKAFAAPGKFQEFEVDFILRTSGYWGFRVYTEGNQPFTADVVKIFPLALLEDRQLLDLYPGSEGAIPDEVQPRKNAYPFRGLMVAGALYDYYRIVDAFHLTAYEMKLDTVPIQKGRSQVYVGFPETAKELFDHNVIYLCGADLTALTLRQKHMLAEYVRRGGGMILFGGHKALDRAGLKGSLLEEVAPVLAQAGVPPLVEFKGGTPVAQGDKHPVTEYADWSQAPVCFFAHDLQARPDAQTILTAGGKPGIVVGKVGKGRVAVIGMACFGGAPYPGPPPLTGEGGMRTKVPFWEWDYWVVLLRDLSWWVAGEDGHF